MAYIGQGIKQGTFKVLDTSGNTYNGSNTTFNLGTQVGSAAQLLVSHDGVIQKAGTDYTLATGGTQITFSTAPASGASIFITEISGAVGGTVTPSDNSVGVTQLNLSDGSSGQFIQTNGSGTLSFASVSSALDDITTGDAASTLATSAGNITIDAQGNDTDIIFKGTDGGSDTTFWTMDGSETGNLVPGSTSTGIYLGVNSATASNLLDDYEEGSWTPIVTTGGANPSYSVQDGRYVKIGNICHVYMELNYTSSSSNTGQWGGLPFTVSNELSGGMNQYISILDGRNTTVYQALLIANDTKWYLRANGTLSGGLQSPSDFSGTRFNMQGSYITA